MALVKFGNIVNDVKVNVDRNNNPYEYYIAGDHMTSEDLTLRRKGKFSTDDVGPAFIRIFKPGQVLYGSRRTYLKKVAVADFEGVTANTTFVLESKNEEILSQRLLPFIMLTDGFTNWSIKKSKGSTNPYILFSDLAEYEFDLPPIEEQERLAKLLWAAYGLKESYKKLIVATDEMVKAQFIEMFGDPITNSKKLPTKTGNAIFELSSGKANTKSNLNNNFKYECYGGNGITGYSSVYLIEEKTIVIGRVGEYCGSVHITNGFSWITDNAIYLKSYNKSAYNFDFIYYLFLFIDLNRFSSRSGQPKITQAPLLSMEYILPPIDKQIEFVQIAQQADKSKAELQQSIENIDKVMKSLLP